MKNSWVNAAKDTANISAGFKIYENLTLQMLNVSCVS